MNATQVSAVCSTVIRRLMLAHWSNLLSRSSAMTFGVLLTAALMRAWFTGKFPSLASTIALVAVWLLITAAWAWFRRPAPTKALAIWDEQSGRHEMFVSAYCFEQSSTRSTGEEMHLSRARVVLDKELPKLNRQLPIVWHYRAWLAPLVFVAVLQLLNYWPRHTAAEVVDPAAQKRAVEVAAALEEKLRDLEPLPGLDETERQQVDSLEQSVQEAADKMKDLEDSTPREALSELEERARAAEELAESLAGTDAGKLSAEMLAEMERHADTADLAAALRANDADKIASEANKLADKLDQKDMSMEERQRIADAFKKTMEAAKDKDRQTPAGKHIDAANQGLQKKKLAEASQQMRDLANSMNRQMQRNQSARQLQQLAKNLRSAGQQIFGRQDAGLQRLAQNQNNPSGLQLVGTPKQIALGQMMPNQPNNTPPAATPPGGMQPPGNPAPGQQPPGGSGAAPTPGQQPGQQGNLPGMAGQPGGAQQGTVPVPGAGNRGNPTSGQIASAAGQKPRSGPIPVPGTQPGGSQGGMPSGGQSPGAGQGQAPGSGQSSGSGQVGANGQPGGSGASSPGGLQAGTGSAAMGNSPTKPMEAKKKEVVKAQVGKDGASQTRAVDPREHTEQAQQEARQTAVDFIKVQEEALADEPLPVSRRDQVRRYFNSLRKQLSTTEPASESKP